MGRERGIDQMVKRVVAISWGLVDNLPMYYCLCTLTGKEEMVKKGLERFFKLGEFGSAIVWFPKKKRRIKLSRMAKGKSRFKEVDVALFPGYIFFYFPYDQKFLDIYSIRRMESVVKLLSYADGTYALRGDDLDVAKWITRFDGMMAISKVEIKEGQKAKILDGPLMGLDGRVKKVDKHKKRIWIDLSLGGLLNQVCFDVDFVYSGGINIS